MPSFEGRRWWFVAKLLAPFMAVSLVSSLALIALLFYTGGGLLKEQLRQRILDEVQFLEYEYQEDGLEELLEEIEERLEKNRQAWRYLYAVHAPHGAWVFDTLPEGPPPLGWARLEQLDYAEKVLAYTSELGEGYRLTVGLSERDLASYQRAFYTNAGWLFALGGVASAVLGALVYRRFRTIVHKVADPVQRFADGEFSTRIPPLRAGPDMERLAANLNAMFVQVERLIAQLRNLSANIAHDLRTPLTRVKNSLAAAAEEATPAARESLARADGELDEVLRLFREILQLSEIQSGRLQTHFQQVDLAAIVADCLEVYAPLLEDQQIKLRLTAPERLELRGSPQLLKQAMVNLVENCLNHTAGQCDLTVTLTIETERILLTVSDNGEAIPSGKPARAHYGLGLGFVSAIAELHGGTAEFGPAAGGGFQCQINLPLRSRMKRELPRPDPAK